MENNIDFIGDVHGHADELERLLVKMGYENSEGFHSHPTRKAFFVGDYIDRGPKIKETLEIIRELVDDPKQSTYKNISIVPDDTLPETSVNLAHLDNSDHYPGDEKPVFFRHYWLMGSPILYRNNICCLDYSVAKQGHLVAYRFDGEGMLDENKFIYV